MVNFDGLFIPRLAITMATIPVAVQNKPSLTTELVWLGLTVPHWVGWLFFIAALVFGSILSTYQDSTVDNYITNKKLKPLYAFGFGLFFTLFGIPMYWKDITVWQLVLPAVVSTTVGAQMVYYMISSGKYMLDLVFKKIGLEPLNIKDIENKEGAEL